ncbi:unnamed protein product [Brachionus calyciflorus]|uniref:tRNA-uridine aminocarboxypropyltransferase n=1 Tax=Brachionus calyciflorus TaxID=104777 RepID=A0A813N087_9BILA|nr:unnamed protein product [Brachionus calyciflorus]
MGETNQCDAHFSLLCNMVDQLKVELDELDCKRDYCSHCDRPVNVCLCPFLPETIKLDKHIKIWIFQHPFEDKRPLRTTRILEKCLEKNNFKILKGRKFTVERFPELEKVYNNENTYVLYPSEDSINLEQFRNLVNINENRLITDKEVLVNDETIFHVILIDGTWPQASGIFYTNKQLHKLKQIKIDTDFKSEYTVRTQPREFFLSTLETVSVILSTIEDKPQIYHDLVRPLKALCEYQFEHGAQPHQSKEYLIFKGLYNKPLSKKYKSYLTKNSKFLNESPNDNIIKKETDLE